MDGREPPLMGSPGGAGAPRRPASKENALVFKQEEREGSWEAAAVSLGIPHNFILFWGKAGPGLRCFCILSTD